MGGTAATAGHMGIGATCPLKRRDSSVPLGYLNSVPLAFRSDLLGQQLLVSRSERNGMKSVKWKTLSKFCSQLLTPRLQSDTEARPQHGSFFFLGKWDLFEPSSPLWLPSAVLSVMGGFFSLAFSCLLPGVGRTESRSSICCLDPRAQ